MSITFEVGNKDLLSVKNLGGGGERLGAAFLQFKH